MRKLNKLLVRLGVTAPDTEFNRRAAAYAELMRSREVSREFQRRKAKRKREAQ